MRAPVIVPEIGADPGERIAVSAWYAEVGDEVFEGDRLIELLVAGVTVDVAAPVTGTLAEVSAEEDDEVGVGDVVGAIETAL